MIVLADETVLEGQEEHGCSDDDWYGNNTFAE
jgi:hypothetical protein